jgi:hypothetical protein
MGNWIIRCPLVAILLAGFSAVRRDPKNTSDYNTGTLATAIPDRLAPEPKTYGFLLCKEAEIPFLTSGFMPDCRDALDIAGVLSSFAPSKEF